MKRVQHQPGSIKDEDVVLGFMSKGCIYSYDPDE
jgi:hypothetical protein